MENGGRIEILNSRITSEVDVYEEIVITHMDWRRNLDKSKSIGQENDWKLRAIAD